MLLPPKQNRTDLIAEDGTVRLAVEGEHLGVFAVFPG